MKEFDLELALNGEPVMLRSGLKAYVESCRPERLYSLSGRIENPVAAEIWTGDGKEYPNGVIGQHDIIGMYEEKQ